MVHHDIKAENAMIEAFGRARIRRGNAGNDAQEPS
jgi:hypothetical protein